MLVLSAELHYVTRCQGLWPGVEVRRDLKIELFRVWCRGIFPLAEQGSIRRQVRSTFGILAATDIDPLHWHQQGAVSALQCNILTLSL